MAQQHSPYADERNGLDHSDNVTYVKRRGAVVARVDRNQQRNQQAVANRYVVSLANAPQLDTPIRHGKSVIVVTDLGKSWYMDSETADMYGWTSADAMEDGGRVAYAYYRPATDAEIAQLEQRERAAVEARAAKQAEAARLAEIKRHIQTTGERPAAGQQPEGERVVDTQDIYGGGDWFVIGPEYIWYVRNNGGDGNDWSANNVRTGGAGAIGWRIPHDAGLAAELWGYDAHIGRGPERRAAAAKQQQEATERAQREAEWTIEVTRQRRRQWNDAIRALSAAHPNGVDDLFFEQVAIERRLGFRHGELLRHVRRHGIEGETA